MSTGEILLFSLAALAFVLFAWFSFDQTYDNLLMWKPGQLITIKARSGTECDGQLIPSVDIVCRVRKNRNLNDFVKFAIRMQRKKYPIIRERCPKDCFVSSIIKIEK